VDLDIKRRYVNYDGNGNFRTYARHELFGEKILGEDSERAWESLRLTPQEEQAFHDEVNTNPAILNARKEIGDIEQRLKRSGLTTKQEKACKHKKWQANDRIDRIKNESAISNPRTDKLKVSLANNTFFQSYGRNQDRFMDFAFRYLAERHYFGRDARFKMYCFYTTSEQEEYIATLDQAQRDKLRYHDARLTHWADYEQHMRKYPYWDTPFVEQNNAVYVSVTMEAAVTRRICVQRNLMYYLLQHALMQDETGSCENAGKALLNDYYKAHQTDLDVVKKAASQKDASNIKLQKKLLPARYIKSYRPVVHKAGFEPSDSFEDMQKETVNAEKRYEALYGQAKDSGRLEDFLKRNKGKQFKLRFVRKAWQLMFFRQVYEAQMAKHGAGHHKAFNITREEFNNFCRWMFAFDEVPTYKGHLLALMRSKHFLDIPEFAALLEHSSSLDDLYQKTKVIFDVWRAKTPPRPPAASANWTESYAQIMDRDDSIWHINISHFTNWLEQYPAWPRRVNGKLDFVYVTRNRDQLNAAYYYADKCEDKDKEIQKLFRKLNSSRLEDALLYELALRYLRIQPDIVQQARAHVSEMLQQDIVFDIKRLNDAPVYRLSMPFKKIDAYVELRRHQAEQELKHRDSFLTRLPAYISSVSDIYGKELAPLKASLQAQPPVLSYDQLHKFEGHIVSVSTSFTDICMAFERYFAGKAWAEKPSIFSSHRIKAEDIPFLRSYLPARRKAFHFGTPEVAYNATLNEMERKYWREEISASRWEDLTKEQSVICKTLLQNLHSNFFDSSERDMKKKHGKAQSLYISKVMNEKGEKNLQQKG
jgi:hypothetical protein